MPDYQQHSLTVSGTSTVTLPRVLIRALVKDSYTGATIADFTGANAITFPDDVATLTQQQKVDLIRFIAKYLVRIKAGTDPDIE